MWTISCGAAVAAVAVVGLVVADGSTDPAASNGPGTLAALIGGVTAVLGVAALAVMRSRVHRAAPSGHLDDGEARILIGDPVGATDGRPLDGPPGDLRQRSVWFVVNVDWFFLSHRAHVAVRAMERGADVTVVCGETGRGDEIRALGVNYVPIHVDRHGLNPLAELRLLAQLYRLYRRGRPHLVHHVSVKPIVWGGLAARLAGVPAVANTICGFGYAFESTGARIRVLRRGLELVYAVVLRHPLSSTVFENEDDRDWAIAAGLVPRDRTALVAGSGVDCDLFSPADEPDGDRVVVLPCRLTWDKGVGDFVEAARAVRAERADVRFVLVGPIDEEYRASVPRQTIEAWCEEGIVEWWGERSDMPSVFASSHLVALPSRFEGMPKVLVEAAACERATIASDVSGCRAAIRDGVTGVLVPPADPAGLADAIRELLDDPERRRRFGVAGRRRAVAELSSGVVADWYVSLYGSLLADARAIEPTA
ncbi:MAG: glycosyltransferase family 4 protein [Actinomycetota bacterium]|nr:glycosyltransferase family 4 protein [Actinomycetota bacterium]